MRIAELESAINEAVIHEKVAGEVDKIQIGSKIKIIFAGEEQDYEVVAPAEANILKNKISYQSPLGNNLVSKREGDSFEYEMGGKKVKVKVLKIT